MQQICAVYKFKENPDICDIGCDDGMISYGIFKQLKAHSLTMFDPYGTFFDKKKLSSNCVYNKCAFQISLNTYDVVMLITCLHHITDPEHLVNQIYLSLKDDGLVIVREHLVETN